MEKSKVWVIIFFQKLKHGNFNVHIHVLHEFRHKSYNRKGAATFTQLTLPENGGLYRQVDLQVGATCNWACNRQKSKFLKISTVDVKNSPSCDTPRPLANPRGGGGGLNCTFFANFRDNSKMRRDSDAKFSVPFLPSVLHISAKKGNPSKFFWENGENVTSLQAISGQKSGMFKQLLKL